MPLTTEDNTKIQSFLIDHNIFSRFQYIEDLYSWLITAPNDMSIVVYSLDSLTTLDDLSQTCHKVGL